jgi:LuxR family transcriptional regulator, maltose regulon positive regulatory protein
MARARQTTLAAEPGLVRRDALFERLSPATPGGVILVCAPAGSGKSVLLRSWVEAEGLAERTAWVSVERSEQDAQRFWLSVIDAFAGVAGADEIVERVSPSPTFLGEAVVKRLLSDLASLETPTVLVIDDLHELASADALRWLELFLARLPRQLRVALTTREEPPIGLHRLRLLGELTELREPDLRFAPEEAQQLLEATGITLSDEAVLLLHERTEGWAAGLRLAAISLAGHPDPARFVSEFSGSERTVAGYLFAEVLERQPPEVRDLLLRTSVVERVNGPLADALTGRSGSEAILQRLEHANAFVTSLDAGRSWFRYHHLLTDLLRLELRRSSPALIDSLHLTAAEWLEQHGYLVDAIRHAQSASDWSHAARLLADNYVDLVFDGRKATLSALLAAFPPDAAEEWPELALAFATTRLYDGHLDESAAHIAAAERLAANVPDDRSRLFDMRLASARLWLACQRGDLQAARRPMPSFEAHSADALARSNDHRASALMHRGMAELWSLHWSEARRDLEEALALARRVRRPYLEIGCLAHLALLAVFSGSSIPLGLRLSEEAVTIAEAHGWGTDRVVGPAVAASAGGLAWLGRIEEAEGWLDRVERPQAPTEEFELEPVLHFVQAFVRIGRGRFEEALAEFRAAERMQAFAPEHALPVDLRAWILITQALMGDTTAARAALAALDAEESDRIGIRIAAATLDLAEGRPEEAVNVLASVVGDVREAVVDGFPQAINVRRATAHALLLDAEARERLGDPRRAEASVERALELSERDGTILPFTLVPVRDVLERLPRHRTAHATLLSTILDVLAGTSARGDRETTPLRDDLSDAELRVLRFLPSNLKAPEIAAELFVSSNTVRTHLRHIYAKLDAHSRQEAVARARELGLLAPGGIAR